jgi:hypothetical protein
MTCRRGLSDNHETGVPSDRRTAGEVGRLQTRGRHRITTAFEGGALSRSWVRSLTARKCATGSGRPNRVSERVQLQVTEGRFTFAQRSASSDPTPPSREVALEMGVPVFVGHCYANGSEPNSASVTVVSDYPEYAARLLLGTDATT